MIIRSDGSDPHRQFRPIAFALAVLGAVLATGTPAQENIRLDIKPWTELEALDAPGSRVQRFAFTARGVSGMEFPIPESGNMFCTLNQQINLLLNYYPATDRWVFQVQLNDSSQFAAGGIATCLDLTKAAGRGMPK